MGSRLPDALPMDAPHGARPSTDAVQVGDLGLSTVAAQYERFADAKKQRLTQEADREAQDRFTAFREENDTALKSAATTYDGKTPGLAKAGIADTEARFKPLLDAEKDPIKRAALQRQFDAYKPGAADFLIKAETDKRIEPLQLRQQAAEDLDLSTGFAAYAASYARRQRERRQSGDGSMTGWAQGSLEDHDAAAADALAAAPEAVRPRLQASLAGSRAKVFASAADIEEQGHLARVSETTKTNIETLKNAILTDPSGYDAAVEQAPALVAALPADLRPGAERETLGGFGEARIGGLIADGDIEQARKEINGGKYDKVWDDGVKERMLARVEAAANSGPKTQEEWLSAYQLENRIDAEVTARATTGRSTGAVSLDEIVKAFGPKEAAKVQFELEQADRTFAATGDVRDQSMDTLRARAAAPPPDPADPDYAVKIKGWQASQQAAAAELKALEADPVAALMRSQEPGDLGAQVQAKWTAIGEAQGAARSQAAAAYVGTVIGLQDRRGVARNAQRVFSKDAAASMVASFVKAEPQDRRAALEAIASVVGALPAQFTYSGRTVAPRQMAARDLMSAGLGNADVSAIVDLADEPARLAAYAGAITNPAALKALPDGQEARLTSAIHARLGDFLESSNALPGSAALNAARVARVQLMARDLVTRGGLSVKDAVRQASADLVDNYRFIDGWRMPKARAEALTPDRFGKPYVPGDQAARRGAAGVMNDLIANDGALLRPAPGAGLSPEQGRRKAADVIEHQGRWVTNEDDGGLTLMVPAPGGWTPALDKYNRAIRLSWDQLIASSQHRFGVMEGDPKAWGWTEPKAAAPQARAAPPARAAQALSAAIEHVGEHSAADAVSPKGALGVRQLTPDTAKAAANRLGIKYEPERLTSKAPADVAYNRRLSDEQLRWLSQRYDGNIALVAAAYNAGPGNVDAWLRRFGDPRRGRVSADEWVASIPFRETRDYVSRVLPGAYQFLTKG